MAGFYTAALSKSQALHWPGLSPPSTPSWVWSKGGINRALVRRAYSDALPVDILDRRKKGTPDCFVAELFESNRHLIRSFLCDGHLAEQGILDREAVARFLADDAPVRDLAYWRIMTLTDVEAWTWSPGTASAI